MNAIMEKKEYIKPEVEVIELDPTSMIAASAPNIGIVDPNDPNGSGAEILSNGRRGKWGNLWADDESK